MCSAHRFSTTELSVAARVFARESSELVRENFMSVQGAKNGFATAANRRKVLPSWCLRRRQFSPADRQTLRVKIPRMSRRAAVPRDCLGLLESRSGRRYSGVQLPALSEPLP